MALSIRSRIAGRRRYAASGGVWLAAWPSAATAFLFGLGALVADAQDQVRDFSQPQLVFNPGGHNAPVRSLVFTPDGGRLTSGGFDKVVHVWELDGAGPGRGPSATIRPPIWRGMAGAIYALALAPEADARGQRLLAVAGFGVENQRGNIGLFRFPGSPDLKTGDLVAHLRSGRPGEPVASGHLNTVTCLAFDRTGRRLVSGSLDGAAILWDLEARRASAVFRDGGPAAPVFALALTPAGRRLVTGGGDGVLRLWDLGRPEAPLARASLPPRNPRDRFGVRINALAISPDGRWVVIGREDGLVVRYAVEGLAGAAVLSNDEETIEALALSPDGRTLATTSIGRLRQPSDLPDVTCAVRLRSFPDGGNPRTVLALDNIAYACTFSPDGRTLAVAGGDTQGLSFVANPGAANQAVTVLRGQGRSLWDVGLRVRPEGLAVGFSYSQAKARQPADRYHGFDLTNRVPTSFAPEELSRALDTFGGWRLRAIDPLTVQVFNAARPDRAFTIALDPSRDRRWWSYSFIPPGPGHDRVMMAVGCESGVWFYRLDDGRPTRLYAGHSGPVYALAPSSDGRWLVTGSSDQTVRLWTLAGCDTLAPLGATFARRADGRWVVTAIAPRSFAEAMGLLLGDLPEQYGIGPREVSEAEFFERLDSVVPNQEIDLIVRRHVERAPGQAAEERVTLGTTKRDGPALSLFVAEEREWVLWMPRGYYDTSIEGDTRFLGWHLNPSGLDRPGPTDYLEILKFERSLRQPRRVQPNILDTLLRTANVGQALAVRPTTQTPEQIVRDGQPPALRPALDLLAGAAPRIRDDRGAAVDPQGPLPRSLILDAGDSLPLKFSITAEGRRPATSFEVRIDGRSVVSVPAYDRPLATREESARLAADPGQHRIAATVRNDLGIARTELLDIEVRGGSPRKQARSKVLVIAPTFQDPAIPWIDYAREDARELRQFFEKHLVSPEDGAPLYLVNDDPLDGLTATSRRVTDAFQALRSEPMRPGDLLIFVIESHVLNFDRQRWIAAADGRGIPPRPSIPADDLARSLGDVAQHKCKVLVLLDGVHTAASHDWDTDLNEWVRHLRDDQNVITFVASNQGPGRAVREAGHRAFALAILNSTRARPPRWRGGPYRLNDFRDVVREGVLALTRRQQFAECYIPETLNGRFTLLDPRPARR